jgi:hypothetical protein
MLVAFNKFFVGDTNCPGATVHGRRQVITMLSALIRRLEEKKDDLPRYRGISSAARFGTRLRRTPWLGRQDSNLCISKPDRPVSVIA